jgi:hypothetical protein
VLHDCFSVGRTFLDRTSRSSRRATQHPEASFRDAFNWVADAYLAVAIVLYGRNGEISESHDEGRVTERLLDAAQFFDLGGGTAWFGNADQQRTARTIPGVPEGRATRSVFALGYPVTSTDPRLNSVQGDGHYCRRSLVATPLDTAKRSDGSVWRTWASYKGTAWSRSRTPSPAAPTGQPPAHRIAQPLKRRRLTRAQGREQEAVSGPGSSGGTCFAARACDRFPVRRLMSPSRLPLPHVQTGRIRRREPRSAVGPRRTP